MSSVARDSHGSENPDASARPVVAERDLSEARPVGHRRLGGSAARTSIDS